MLFPSCFQLLRGWLTLAVLGFLGLFDEFAYIMNFAFLFGFCLSDGMDVRKYFICSFVNSKIENIVECTSRNLIYHDSLSGLL